jgi:hypothetical protein
VSLLPRVLTSENVTCKPIVALFSSFPSIPDILYICIFQNNIGIFENTLCANITAVICL